MSNAKPTLLDTVLEQPNYIKHLTQFIDEKDDTRALQYCVDNFIDKHKFASAKAAHNALLRIVAELDSQINEQINNIIHHPKLQKLEASWRGLWLLVKQAESCRSIKVKMLDMRWTEVVKDINKAKNSSEKPIFLMKYIEYIFINITFIRSFRSSA